jgi:hypothetical protein
MNKKIPMVFAACFAATLFAQGPPAGRGPGRGGMMGFGPGMGRTVAGAPYSALEVVETSQTLSGGNAISTRTQSNVYRDGMGRVRTETTGSARTTIRIHDPVAGVVRELDTQAKVVRETPLPAFRGANGPPRYRTNDRTSDPNVATETLAMQTINGVQATGVRVTRTIPAGQIGNQQPIVIVRETWQSVDLKVPVMTRTSDPRFGTVTTQLTNITRAEPDPALFQAPADYTVTRGRGPGGMRPGPGKPPVIN